MLDSPAFLACARDEIVGLLAYLPEPAENCLTIIMLNVLPAFQGQGAGRALLDAAIAEARRLDLGYVRVSTSNDDLPALYVYQRAGFHLTGLATGAILAHHGGVEAGFAGIPVRDEVRLALPISSQ